MKYRITVNVDGATLAINDYTVNYTDLTIGVITEQRRVKTIYIEKKTSDEDIPPSVQPGNGKVKHLFTFRSPACREELIEKLIYLESLGAFWWHIKSFNINEAREEWIPESEADREKISFAAMSMKQEYTIPPMPMHDHQIKALLEMEQDEKQIAVPLAFYREGSISFEGHKYINAFQNYFLMIEGLFGQGKSGYRAQLKALQSSSMLQIAVKKMLGEILSDKTSTHYKTLAQELEDLDLAVCVDNVIDWLVRTRGRLSHFSVTSAQKHGQPHLNREYRAHAYFAQGVCLFTYTEFHTDILRNNGYVKQER